jgi:NADH dehydrogenase (ubiquinone) Fe-S protein 1
VEAAMVNARIQKTVRATQAKVGYIGPAADFNYDHQHLGKGVKTLIEIAEGRHPFCSALLNAKNPAIIVGAGLFESGGMDTIFSAVETISKYAKIIRPDWNGFNVLLLSAAQAAALDLGLVRENCSVYPKFVYLMGADDVAPIQPSAFIVYQGHHADKSLHIADVILPAAAFSEKEGTYENTEGCVQQTFPAVPTIGDARDDWKIIRAVSEVAGVTLPYDSLGEIRSRMKTVAPNLVHMDEREPATFSASLKPNFSRLTSLGAFRSAIDDFYRTDSITRKSNILLRCSYWREWKE